MRDWEMEFPFKNVQEVTILIQSEKNNVIETLTNFQTKETEPRTHIQKGHSCWHRVGKRKMN